MMKKQMLFFCFVMISIKAFTINPLKEYKVDPSSLNIDFEEYKIGTKDGHCLNVWYMESKIKEKRNATILIAGSDAGNMGFSLAYAQSLLQNGFDVVCFDYRGFGSSSDFKHDKDALYHLEYVIDFETAMEWLKRSFKPNNIAVLSFSMGSLIATLGKEAQSFDYMIAESFITSPQKIVDRISSLKNKKISIPSLSITYEERLKTYTIPFLLFASKSDKITTLEDSKTFAEASANRKIIAHDGGHLMAARTIGGKEYAGLIVDFLKNDK